MPVPSPVRLFHITALANLQAICAARALLSKNAGATAGIAYQNIAHAGAQGSRAQRRAPDPPGGTLHDYVPFYFAPRSPMLRAIDGGQVHGCPWRQVDIVHLQTTVDRATAGGRAFVFYDRNATLQLSNAYTDLQRLDCVAWDLFFEPPLIGGYSKYWHNRLADPRHADRMERRQAEFLVRDAVGVEALVAVGVANPAQALAAQRILDAAGVPLRAEVKPEWYFMPGQ